MIFRETKLKGAYWIRLEPVEDGRGLFARSFCRESFKNQGLNPDITQCNTSYCKSAGTLRGMHYQVSPHEETKLVQCVRGRVYDVVIDLRPESPTFKQWTGIALSADVLTLMYVPRGFAHGYLSLTDDTTVYYLVSEPYHPECERTVRWDDPSVSIWWPKMSKYIISEKDKNADNI
jgi:dTDP-4-dehydrorhamnose 3,5-epimerase